MKSTAVLCAVVFMSLVLLSPCEAETVKLKNGNQIIGEIVEQNDTCIKIKVKGITTTVQREEIFEIQGTGLPAVATPVNDTPADFRRQYERKLKVLVETDTAAQYALGAWCASVSLKDEAVKHLLVAAAGVPPSEAAHDDLARLDLYLLGGKACSFDQARELIDKGLPLADLVDFAGRAARSPKLPVDRRLEVLSRVSIVCETAKDWKSVQKLWPDYTRLSQEEAKAEHKTAIADEIAAVARRCPEGVLESTEPNAEDAAGAPTVIRKVLARPELLDAEVQKGYRKYLDESQKLMDKAGDEPDRDKAYNELLVKAGELLDRADALVPGSARELRPALANRRMHIVIAALTGIHRQAVATRDAVNAGSLVAPVNCVQGAAFGGRVTTYVNCARRESDGWRWVLQIVREDPDMENDMEIRTKLEDISGSHRSARYPGPASASDTAKSNLLRIQRELEQLQSQINRLKAEPLNCIP